MPVVPVGSALEHTALTCLQGVSYVPGSLPAHLPPSSSLCPGLCPHMPLPGPGGMGIEMLFPGSLRLVSSCKTSPCSLLSDLCSHQTEPGCGTSEGQGQGARGNTGAAFILRMYSCTLDQVHLTQSQGGGESISVIISSNVCKPQMSTLKAKLQS